MYTFLRSLPATARLYGYATARNSKFSGLSPETLVLTLVNHLINLPAQNSSYGFQRDTQDDIRKLLEQNESDAFESYEYFIKVSFPAFIAGFLENCANHHSYSKDTIALALQNKLVDICNALFYVIIKSNNRFAITIINAAFDRKKQQFMFTDFSWQSRSCLRQASVNNEEDSTQSYSSDDTDTAVSASSQATSPMIWTDKVTTQTSSADIFSLTHHSLLPKPKPTKVNPQGPSIIASLTVSLTQMLQSPQRSAAPMLPLSSAKSSSAFAPPKRKQAPISISEGNDDQKRLKLKTQDVTTEQSSVLGLHSSVEQAAETLLMMRACNNNRG